ncbi:YehS family protein [Enterococcus sp. LJL98]
MNHNDRLTRLRYALDIRDMDMVKIFELGGMKVTKEEVREMLTKKNDEEYEFDLTDEAFERFLNGMIISQRGVREGGQAPIFELHKGNANNLLLKKLKIALSLTSEDMLETLERAGVIVSKGEMSAILRKEGHRNYKPCGDRYARNFIKGLMLAYRGEK